MLGLIGQGAAGFYWEQKEYMSQHRWLHMETVHWQLLFSWSNGQINLSYSEEGEGDTEREFEEIKYRVSCLIREWVGGLRTYGRSNGQHEQHQAQILTELQAFARSILERPFNSVSNTFIFSTRQVRAVSVASPTFSYTPFACNWKHTNYKKGKVVKTRKFSLIKTFFQRRTLCPPLHHCSLGHFYPILEHMIQIITNELKGQLCVCSSSNN